MKREPLHTHTRHSLHEFTVGSVGAETGEVVHTQDTTHMSVSALWTVAAESSIVPRAVLHLHIGIDVQERTLLIVARIYGVGGVGKGGG